MRLIHKNPAGAKRLRVCYILSYYFPSYVRSQTIINGLQQIPGAEVYTAVNTTTHIWRYAQTCINLLKTRFQHKPDIYILGFRGYELYWLIRLLTIGKQLIFDHMMSPYDSLVHEKKSIKAESIWGKLLYWYEKTVLANASLVLTDTDLHKQFFSEHFHIEPAHFDVIPVGADESLFYPQTQPISPQATPFSVFFYSSFLPLHGIDIILEAAILLRPYPIQLILVGGHKRNLTQFYQTITQNQLTNIVHHKWVDYEQLPSLIAQADLCLGGPFGNTGQAKRVITGKTYQFLAMAKPTVVGELARVSKFFQDKDNCLLVPQGDAAALADAIYWAYENQTKLSAIATGGYELYQSFFSASRISQRLETILLREVLVR